MELSEQTSEVCDNFFYNDYRMDFHCNFLISIPISVLLVSILLLLNLELKYQEIQEKHKTAPQKRTRVIPGRDCEVIPGYFKTERDPQKQTRQEELLV